jgi:hypothetical protein
MGQTHMNADAQTQIDAIDRELIGTGFNYSGVLASNGAEHQRAHESRRNDLMAKRAALALQLPQQVTGERAGHMVIAHTLGTVWVRASEPVYALDQHELDLHGEDPYLRFAAECGEDYR